MKRTITFLAAIIAVISLPGCATIVSKTSNPVTINTTPVNATITITDKKGQEIYKGKTPTIVSLKSGAGFFSKAEYQVKLDAYGYDEQIIPITYSINGWYFGNVLFGGAIGLLIVDPATGAMWKLDNKAPISVTLNKSEATAEPQLQIMDIANVPSDMKGELVRIK